MQKYKFNKTKLYLLCTLIYFLLFLIFDPSKDLNHFLITITLTFCILFLVDITNHFNQDGLYFSQDGIIQRYLKKDHLIKWQDLQIETKIKYRFIYLINIKMNHLKRGAYQLIIFWPTEKNIIELTKKYCPPDHELYKIVEEYPKERNLPF